MNRQEARSYFEDSHCCTGLLSALGFPGRPGRADSFRLCSAAAPLAAMMLMNVGSTYIGQTNYGSENVYGTEML